MNDTHQRPRESPRISVALSVVGGAAVIIAMLFLGAAFYVRDDLVRAFCLGAFFTGLLGAIMLFGFAKVIDALDLLRTDSGEPGP